MKGQVYILFLILGAVLLVGPMIESFVIGSGVTFIIESDVASSTEYKYATSAFVGDSKTEGVGGSTWANGYPRLTYASSSKKSLTLSKLSNLTNDVLNNIPEIIAFAPEYVVLNLGSNDLRTGVSAATWKSRYASIRDQLVAAGISVIHIRPPKESSLNVAALDTFVQTFTNDLIVDCYTGWNIGTMLGGDGIHPNDTGMQYQADQIEATVPQIL